MIRQLFIASLLLMSTLSGFSQLTLTYTITEPLCNGDSNGAIDITVTGGTAPYSYGWSNGTFTEDQMNITAGSYVVGVIDLTGSFVTDTIVLTEPPAINATTVPTNTTSIGGTDGSIDLTVTGGTSPYMYMWSTSDTTEDINNLPAGIYTVTVTDANGCTSVVSATVMDPTGTGMMLTFSMTLPTCPGDADGAIDLTVVNGTSPFTYAWNTGDTTEDLTNIAAGTYTVTVTDSTGTTTTSTTILNDPQAVSGSTNVTNTSAVGASDGAIDLTPSGGTGPYSFVWSTADTTEDISNLTAGSYTVTITDANGCTGVVTAVVFDPGSGLLLSGAVTDVTCPGASTGAIDLTVLPAGGVYTFSWSNGATTEDLTGLAAGTYTVMVADSGGLTGVDSFVVAGPPAWNLSSVNTNVSVVGGSDGAIDLTVTGGTPGYTFLWSNGDTTEDISNLTLGTYSVTVTDANGCTTVYSTFVHDPVSILLSTSITTTDVTCTDTDNGSADLTVTNGTPPYTYNWSNGSTMEDQIGLAAGTYTVTVTDASGTTAVDFATIGSNPMFPNPVLGPVTGPTVVQANQAYFYSLQSTNGSSYSWNPIGGTTVSNANNLVQVQWGAGPTGQLIVTETNQNGCQDIDTIQIFIGITSVGNVFDSESLSLFPNPTSGKVQFRAAGTNEGSLTVQLLNIQGKMVFEKRFAIHSGDWTGELDLTDMPSGIYFGQFVSGDNRVVKKIIRR